MACINMVAVAGSGSVRSGAMWRCAAFLFALHTSTALNGDTSHADNEEYLLKQVIWKRCYRKLSPSCLKLNLVRTVELMSRNSSFPVLPGVFFSSNSSGAQPLPPDIARSLSSDQAPLDDLVSFTVNKYLRSLTLDVNLVDFVSGGNETLQNSVIDVFAGRAKKDGFGGYGAMATMMGGMMASVMMAGLAALAGKALMTSLVALMMAAFSAMKGGGGGGDHESKTYEVITKPVVSHINTHSSEVQHEHGHYHKRSLDGRGQKRGGVPPRVLLMDKGSKGQPFNIKVPTSEKLQKENKFNGVMSNFYNNNGRTMELEKLKLGGETFRRRIKRAIHSNQDNYQRGFEKRELDKKQTNIDDSAKFNFAQTHQQDDRHYKMPKRNSDHRTIKRDKGVPPLEDTSTILSLDKQNFKTSWDRSNLPESLSNIFQEPGSSREILPSLKILPRRNLKEHKDFTDDLMTLVLGLGLFR